MAEEFIEEIYQYSKLITIIKDTTKNLYCMQTEKSVLQLEDKLGELINLSVLLLREKNVWAQELAEAIVDISEHTNDIGYICDKCNINIIPILQKIIKQMGEINVEADDNYILQSSYTGYLTIKSKNTGRFFHSLYDPMLEAKEYVESVFQPEYSNYVVFGCGLGYQIYQLFEVSGKSIKITVYERNPQIVQYAMNYGVLGWIPEENLNVVVDSDILTFLRRIDEDDNLGIMLLLNAINEIEDEVEREALMGIYVQYNTAKNQKTMGKINFYRNIEMNIPDVSILKDPVSSEAIVVAAGPTLDYYIDFLKEWKGKRTIIAVMTVFRKLIQMGIKPDYVMALDPSDRMEDHLKGLENEDVPVIVDANVYWKWTHEYKGPKYMVYSSAFLPEIKDYIVKNKKEQWSSGGTVTYMAIQFAIRNHAKKIYLIGADMGYPGEVTHASGTAHFRTATEYDTLMAEGVYGGKIRTNRLLNAYRDCIEKLVEKNKKEVEVYNLSPSGARIKGTIEVGRKMCPVYKSYELYGKLRVLRGRKDITKDEIKNEITKEINRADSETVKGLIEVNQKWRINNPDQEPDLGLLLYEVTGNELFMENGSKEK